MKKYFYLIIIALISSLVLTGCLLSNVGQVPSSEQSGITYLTKGSVPNLVGLWHFDGDAFDSSGNANDGTIYGASWAPGKFGQALSFDGINNYVEVTDPGMGSSLDVDRITIEAWIYFDTNRTGNNNIVRKGPYADRTYGLDIGVPGMNRIRGWVNLGPAGGSGALIASGDTILETDQWYHVAMTYDGSRVRVYVDSMQDGISGTTTGNIFDNNQSLRIGGQPLAFPEGRLPFKGLIDEVRIWKIALTEDKLGDIIPPTLTKELTGTVGLAGWYTSDVVVTLTGDDPTPGSGFNRVEYSFDGTTWSIYDTPFTISAEGTTTLYHRAYDNAGNVYVLPAQEIKIDKTLPVVTITVPADGAQYILGQSVFADWTATDAVPGSGLASSEGTVPNGSPIDTGMVGSDIFTVTATDNAGNTAEVTLTYYVRYNFIGFLPPVDNLPTVNVVKAGRTIPVKWQLKDAEDAFISSLDAVRYNPLRYNVINCENGAPTELVVPVNATTTGATSLRYDSTNNQYVFNWQTSSTFAGKCIELLLDLNDGTQQTALFRFTK
jgi:hypothetical protein